MVRKSVGRVKLLHVLMTLIWPVAVVFVVSGGSFLQHTYQKTYIPYYNTWTVVLLMLWLLYDIAVA